MSLQLHIPRTKPSVTLNQTNQSENLVTDCCHVSIMSISNVHVCVKAQARKYAKNLPFNWFRMHCSICLNFCVVTSRYQAHEAFADADVTCSRMSIWVYEQKKWLTEKKTTNNNNWEKKTVTAIWRGPTALHYFVWGTQFSHEKHERGQNQPHAFSHFWLTYTTTNEREKITIK